MDLQKTLARCLSAFIPTRSKRKEFRRKISGWSPLAPVQESVLAHKYLDGLNGIEIGASTQNGFGMDATAGAYATVDFDSTQGEKWQEKEFDPVKVNIVASGDDLPFKDHSLEYVLTSHVIEHFFDPIKALKEWHRVTRKGGYIFLIVPHKERTFDCNRQITPLSELIDRHTGTLKLSDYAYLQPEQRNHLKNDSGHKQGRLTPPHQLLQGKKPSLGWTSFKKDDHHHWSVWTTESFLELCRHLQLNVVETQDPDDKVGNGFTVVIQKA